MTPKPTPETDAIAAAYVASRKQNGADGNEATEAFHALPQDLTYGHYRPQFVKNGDCKQRGEVVVWDEEE